MDHIASQSTGRRIWAILAIIISVLVLLLAGAATVGTRIGRSAAIKLNTTLMDGVIQLTDNGRQGVDYIRDGVDEIRAVVAEEESATD